MSRTRPIYHISMCRVVITNIEHQECLQFQRTDLIVEDTTKIQARISQGSRKNHPFGWSSVTDDTESSTSTYLLIISCEAGVA